MKQKIIFISIAVIAIGFLFWGRNKSSTSGGGAILATGVTPATVSGEISPYDFGSVSMARGKVEHDFALKNTADGDLVIDRVETSCMCTKAVLGLPDGKEIGPFGMLGHGFTPSVNAVVHPGETVTVRAVFDPAAHGPAGIGKVERQIILGTNKGQYKLGLSADVTP